MRWWLAIRFWLRARVRGGALRAEIEEELAYHVRMRAEEFRAKGMSREAARRAARASFGGMEQARRACREQYMVDSDEGDGMLSQIVEDLRFTLRSIARKPAFSAAVMLTLGLGIGANSAIFSVLHGVLLTPLPYEEAHELVRLWQADRVNETRFENFSAPDFFDVLERSSFFTSASMLEYRSLTLTGPEDDAQRLTSMAASHNYMDLLAVPLAQGRWFTPDEDAPGGAAVAVLGHGLWTTRFGRDPSVIGRSIRLDGIAHRVVGVAAAQVEFPQPGIQIWVPTRVTRETRPRNQHNFRVVARLASDASLDQANANLTSIAGALEEEYAQDNVGREMWAQPLQESIVGDVSAALYLLSSAVALVLLIACLNVANLLLVRGDGREREVAIRLAMGAGRRRLLRQFLTEYVVLGGLGGLVGLGLAIWGVRALVGLSPESLPRLDNVGIDGPVLAFTLVTSLAAGLLCGLLPALRGARTDLRSSLTDGGRTSTRSLDAHRLRSGLVVLEVAMAVVLVSSAGLLIKSFSRVLNVDPGFTAAGVLSAQVELPASQYAQSRPDWPNYPEVLAFQHEVVERALQLPGVTSAGLAVNGPTDPGWTTGLSVEGAAPDAIDPTEEVRIRIFSSGYPEAIGMELVRGRLPDPRDDLFETQPVALINEAMAERYFPDTNAIGKWVANWGIQREVIGIVRDVRFMGLTEPFEPAVYPLFARMPFGAFSILIRTTADPAALVGPLRAQIAEVDADLAIGSVALLADLVFASTGQTRFNTLLLSLFAVASLVLAAVGIYGVISYGVSQRTHEIGVRLSLGASGRSVAGQIVARALGLTTLGIVIGLLATIGTSRMLASLLFGVEVFDPVHLLAVIGLSTAVATVASYVPARRASRVHPIQAMRGE